MSALKLHTLKQKLWAIVAASFVARVVVFFLLPNTPSSLGPDEGTYASLTKWIGDSKPAEEFPLYGEGLYLSGRSLILPASYLYRFGFHELDAIRFVSSLYAFSALTLVAFVALKLFNELPQTLSSVKNSNLVAGLFLTFAFMPSHFIWSNLGLRESATEFWLIASFIVFFYIFHHQKTITFPGILLLVGTVTLTFSARPQVGWVIAASLGTYLCFNLKTPKARFLLPVVLSAVILGGLSNVGNIREFVDTRVTANTVENFVAIFNPVIKAAENVDLKHQANQVDAASMIKTIDCPREQLIATATPSTKFDTYFCIAWRAPYMISTFLFRPTFGADITSTASLIAASENLLWTFSCVTLLFLIIKKRYVHFLNPLMPSILFFVLYVSGASAYQGNMGTGFRHKSLILWVVLLLLFAVFWRGQDQSRRSRGNNSQERAV
jgi:hypothetical protein